MTLTAEDKVQRFLGKETAKVTPIKETVEEKEARYQTVADNIADKLEASQKPKGHFAIPELLDERRLKYGIPNGAFEIHAVFDRVYVWQVTEDESEFYGDSGIIVKTDHAKMAERNITPRGVLVSAGLQALDCLRDAGVELGHMVKFVKLSPFDMTVDDIDGTKLKVMVLRDGDIVGSEDISTSLNDKTSRIVAKTTADGKRHDHRIVFDGEPVPEGTKSRAFYDPCY